MKGDLPKALGVSDGGVKMENRGSGDRSAPASVQESGVVGQRVPTSMASAPLIKRAKTREKTNYLQEVNKRKTCLSEAQNIKGAQAEHPKKSKTKKK